MGIVRAISPELLEAPAQAWQQNTKVTLELLKGRLTGKRITMEEGSALYLKSLYRCGQSESTIRRCYYYLKIFIEWCLMTGIEDLEIRKTEVRSFLLYCKKDRNLGTVTLRMYYWKIKGLFTFLADQSFISEHPMETFALPTHGSKKIMRVLSQDESSHLLETVVAAYQALPAHHLRFRFFTLRDLVILELLLATGLRVSELAMLTIADVDLANGLLSVQGKGSDLYVKRNRMAFIDLPLLKADLNTYLSLRGGDKQDRLFPSKHNASMSPAAFDVMVKKWGQRAGIAQKLHCHLFRHTFCTRLILNGADIYSVQKLMGHHDVETTLKFYLHFTPEEIEADWKKFNPLGGR